MSHIYQNPLLSCGKPLILPSENTDYQIQQRCATSSMFHLWVEMIVFQNKYWFLSACRLYHRRL